MIDDATNRTWARFSEEETTEACYEIFEQWTHYYGLPLSLYVDRDSIYRCERKPTIAEQLACKEPQTQFGRAMEKLGVELILAHSPQAKGRVERRNGLFQDRLIKAMRLAGIADLAQANRFLEKPFLPELNQRFIVEPASAADLHRRPPRDLYEVLSWEEERVVRKDWTVGWEGRWFHEGLSLADRPVVVRRLRSGQIQLLHGQQKLRWKELPARPSVPARAPRRVGRTELVKPEAEHPWRKFGFAASQRYRQQAAAPPHPPGRHGRGA
jgi:hypothetical protein